MAHFSDLDTGLAGPSYSGQAAPAPRSVGLYRGFFKRGLDILLVLLSAPFVLPVVLLLGLMITRDGGPAFYSQDRIGRGGRVFRLWKLRSMVVEADAELEAYLAPTPPPAPNGTSTRSSRTTRASPRVGRLIRKASLDELPQLWNVLIGDMSLVGPRPMMPFQAGLYPGRDYYGCGPG